MAAQPVAEEQHAVDLWTSDREDMEINVCVRSLEHPMRVPVWLADAEHVARRLQGWDIRWLVGRVRNHQQQVDAWFGCQPRHRGRADVVKPYHVGTERSPHPLGFAREEARP